MKPKLKTSKQKTDSTSKCGSSNQAFIKPEAAAEFSLNEDAPSYEIKRSAHGYYFQWEPLGKVPYDDEDRIDFLKSVAMMLYPHSLNEDRQLVNQARDVFVALAAYLFDNYEDESQQGFPNCSPPTLAAIRRMTLGNTSGEIMISYHIRMLSQRKFLSEKSKQLFELIIEHNDDTLQLVMDIVREPAMAQLALH
jgi:HD-GYP domain-containing protein (c-di-GMP phosphodiesterase class II)